MTSRLVAAAFLATCLQAPVAAGDTAPPELLTGTGTFAGRVPADALPFAPRYPLWTDGADKRRWIALPPGTSVDASRVDAWEFPAGTRLWKEFSYGGRAVETRFMQRRADGSWLFATYLWNENGTQATLAPARGIARLAVRGAPEGRYAVPSRTDCLACHGSAPVPVLGFTALQLSRESGGVAGARDGLDLVALVRRGVVSGLPASLQRQPPQIAGTDPAERAALGYLHGNCAHCHNTGPTRAPLSLTLAQRAGDPAAARAEVLRSLVRAETRFRPGDAAAGAPHVVVPGDAEGSLLVQRMASRDSLLQMPPLGTLTPDPQGLHDVRRWIDLMPSTKENHP